MKPSLTAALVILFTVSLMCVTYGQKRPPIKFGKPLSDELKMTSFPEDTTAHAVILYDQGHFSKDNFTFSRHIRLKVLRKAGTSYANFEIRSPDRSSIEGYTYNLENGMVVEKKLAKENIFREEIVEGFDVYKVFFPGVREGSVIDLRYYHLGLPFEWRFQDRIPVVYNELILENSPHVIYKKTMFGFGRVQQKNEFTWFAENMPALQEEPLMSHYSNYLTKFRFDIEKLTGAFRTTDLSSTWSKISERLMESQSFGGVIRESHFLNEKASEIRNLDEPIQHKIQQAYSYIQDNIKWNNSSSLLASLGYREHFRKDHSGNSAEINLLLVSLLKKSGIHAYPLVLSTRNNGLLNPMSASINSANYVAAFVRDGGIEMVLDAAYQNATPGILPPHCRNLAGWVVDGNGGWWIDLSSGKSKALKQFITIDLRDETHHAGEISTYYEDYAFLEWLDEYQKENSEDAFNKSIIARTKEVEVEDASLVSIDKTKLKSVYKIRINLDGSQYLQDFGSEMALNPFLLCDISNPFKSSSRMFPIDFVMPWSKQYIISIMLPTNCAVESLPAPLVLQPETGGGKFAYYSILNNNIVTIKCDLKVERQIFAESDYHAIRNFFSEVSRKLSEQIQIRKKS